ncbi:hypothetical protein DAERI_010041 [Deinococcus aerius]|uniref:Uncharacterized protein n=2 Tax=Deinococcus aerius TaxID=200253 RepID=A0A2I9CQZ6_9DEIO|nr:hypothetical protein DAERI_010041 [Deinococcus aerius]
MRYVSFVNARNLLYLLLRQHPDGITAKEMDALVKREGVLTTQRGKGISRTTTFHVRNALYHLGLLELRGRLYVPTSDAVLVEHLAQAEGYSKQLTTKEKVEFARHVVENADCRDVFLWLFGTEATELEAFVERAGTVRWRSEDIPGLADTPLASREGATPGAARKGQRRWRVVMTSPAGAMTLETEDEVQAVFYGVRYWLMQLDVLDEMFFEGEGGHTIMFATDPRNSQVDILPYLKRELVPGVPWTPLHLRPLMLNVARDQHATLEATHAAFRRLARRYPQYVYLIATARSFATITASSATAEEFQLRGYLRDDQGRIISHARVHEKIGDLDDTAV